jgi:hypothetical protein
MARNLIQHEDSYFKKWLRATKDWEIILGVCEGRASDDRARE